MASLSTALTPEVQEEIRAAGLESGEVDGHVDVPELTEPGEDRLAVAVLPQPGQLVERDLEPREPVVMADAELPEPERSHVFLGGVDPAELLGGDLVAVLEARGQARERRLVPCGQAECSRELADLGLAETGVDQPCGHA